LLKTQIGPVAGLAVGSVLVPARHSGNPNHWSINPPYFVSEAGIATDGFCSISKYGLS
jgi:hypothetical protein